MEINENLNFKIGKTINGEKIKLTKDGYYKREQRLYDLINHIRPKILDELSKARKQGDLTENADYDAAKNKQSQIENEIFELEALLTKAEIIESVNSEEVQIGSKVEYLDLGLKETKLIKIVDSAEVDPLNHPPFISDKSPISLALINGKIGEIKEVKTSKRIYKIQIINLS